MCLCQANSPCSNLAFHLPIETHLKTEAKPVPNGCFTSVMCVSETLTISVLLQQKPELHVTDENLSQPPNMHGSALLLTRTFSHGVTQTITWLPQLQLAKITESDGQNRCQEEHFFNKGVLKQSQKQLLVTGEAAKSQFLRLRAPVNTSLSLCFQLPFSF